MQWFKDSQSSQILTLLPTQKDVDIEIQKNPFNIFLISNEKQKIAFVNFRKLPVDRNPNKHVQTFSLVVSNNERPMCLCGWGTGCGCFSVVYLDRRWIIIVVIIVVWDWEKTKCRFLETIPNQSCTNNRFQTEIWYESKYWGWLRKCNPSDPWRC